ncbi:cytochrome P450 family 71 protein [Medicago truncatula]|uniref:Cytochrome P450 family 71 protein n=2 Tax=Medicago truncatula TaxID=3880 RepID=G7IUZ2_MEDTR|nr:cytochrome P450 family 71 protein [Medicago truncatula]
MDLQTIFPLALFSIFLLLIIVTINQKKKTDSIPNIPPGPTKKLGELSKIHGPLMHLQLGEVCFIIVSSAEYAKEIMKTHDVTFSSSLQRVQSLWPVREQEISNLVKKIASEEGCVLNLSQHVVSMLFSITSRAEFGKKYMEQDEFVSLVREVLHISGGFYIGDLFPSAKWLQNFSRRRPKLEKLHKKVDRMIEMIINDHKVKRSRGKEGFVEGRK